DGSIYNFDTIHTVLFENRNSVPDSLQIGLLKRIIFPTGGRCEFCFEPHSFSSYVSDNGLNIVSREGIAGGVRIKSIMYYDINNEIIGGKEYKYVNDYLNAAETISSGVLSYWPRYQWNYFRYTQGIISGGQHEYIKESEKSII